MPLPNLIIAGAQKSGTTTLHEMLGQHAAIFMSDPKEIHFFDRHFARGVDWYREQFREARNESVVGESTPYYMYNGTARDRMIATLHDVKVIVIVREPAARAYSHYWFAREKGIERQETFEDAIRREPRRLQRSADGKPAARSYVDRGFYIDQIEALAAGIGRGRLQVHLMEDLIDAPTITIRSVFEFLGVDPQCADSIRLEVTNRFGDEHRRTPGVVERRRGGAGVVSVGGYPPMNKQTRSELRTRYRPANERLEEWLGRDLSHWY